MSLVETLNRQHEERLARFAWAAKHPKLKAKPVTHEVPNKPYAEVVVLPVDISAWAERQKQNYKEPWFEITHGPREFYTDDRPAPRIDRIQLIVCDHYDVTRNDMVSVRRNAYLVFTRQVAIYLCKQLTPRSFSEIGRRFGDRDHTTVMHSIRTISRMIGEDIEFAAEVEALRKKCEG